MIESFAYISGTLMDLDEAIRITGLAEEELRSIPNTVIDIEEPIEIDPFY